MTKSYRGRFAPSPTGDLHLGSMLAAVASFCQARSQSGEWLIRIEDVDETRVIPSAAELIISTLHQYGMASDEPVIYQTEPERQHAYQQAMQQLSEQDLTYRCQCTRKMLAGLNKYPGTCLNQPPDASALCSVRLKTDGQSHMFSDHIQGHQTQPVDGDFIIKRKDNLFAYQLAVVVDDQDQGITEVVRGIDIMPSTGMQMHLIKRLAFHQPDYAHIPIALNANGDKLSKQNHATPITHEDPYEVLWFCLRLLQQKPPQQKMSSVAQLLQWATEHWSVDALAGKQSVDSDARIGG